MEVLLLAAVVISPWPFGSVEPPAEASLYALVAVLLVLWGVRMILDGEFRWQHCPVAFCLSSLFLLAFVQTIPLSTEVLERLSPPTARLYALLLPTPLEQIADADEDTAASGFPLSFYPAGTRRAALRLLAVTLVFCVVRNNLASVASLRRLSAVAVMNGAMLSILGIVHLFSARPGYVYWNLQTGGTVFGPFICRNHFPFYVNMCLGLGLGLLLSLKTRTSPGGHQRQRWSLRQLQEMVHELLSHPWAPWVTLALGLCAAGTLFSLSRGGMLTLFATILVCLALAWRIGGRSALVSAQSLALLFGALLSLSVAYWFGYDQITARAESLLTKDASEETRLPMWLRGLRIAWDFPVLGTGQGTFQYIEPLYRTDAAEEAFYFDHAHNEYIEALAEGGVIRLALSLFGIALLWRFGLRALRRYRGSSSAGLIWGALFALCTLVIHSMVDFGVHVPAITLLAAVVAAQLCGRGDGAGAPQAATAPGGRSAREEDRAPLRWGGLAPYAAAFTLLALGLILCGSGWSYYVTHQLREAAYALKDRKDRESIIQQAVYLDAASRLNQDFAHLEVSRARAYSRLFDEFQRQGAKLNQLWGISQLILDSAANPGVATLPPLMFSERWRQMTLTVSGREIGRHNLVAAARAYLHARNSCPLFEEPHRALVRYLDVLKGADKRENYLARAKLLAPGVPLVWYHCGLDEMDEDGPQAMKTWRHCLELSDTYLPQIIDESKYRFSAAQIRTEILPRRPSQLFVAALRLYPAEVEDYEELRKPFLDDALSLLQQSGEKLDYNDRLAKAKILRLLERHEEAIPAYKAALVLKPREIGVRLELADYLFQREQLGDAEKEVRKVRHQEPRNQAALQLLGKIDERKLRKGS
jgi:O-antigen ligase